MSDGLIGGILSGTGAIIDAGTGLYNSIQGNKLNREQFEYNKQLQQTIFDREDTRYQRMSKDLEAAGFSKFGALSTGGSNAGAVVGTNLEHKNVNINAIQGLNSLGEMVYNLKQQEANINLSNSQASLLQSQVLTEAQKRLNMIKDSELTEAQKQQLMTQTQEMIDSINWHWRNVARPRDYNRGQVGQVAEDLVGSVGAAFSDTFRSIKNLFGGFKK